MTAVHSRLSFLARPEAKVTWHHILSFSPGINVYLKKLEKGARVFVEANYELREPDFSADPSTPQGQRQIYLRHGIDNPQNIALLILTVFFLETIRVIGSRPNKDSRAPEEEAAAAAEDVD
jgi:hypothetical protein